MRIAAFPANSPEPPTPTLGIDRNVADLSSAAQFPTGTLIAERPDPTSTWRKRSMRGSESAGFWSDRPLGSWTKVSGIAPEQSHSSEL